MVIFCFAEKNAVHRKVAKKVPTDANRVRLTLAALRASNDTTPGDTLRFVRTIAAAMAITPAGAIAAPSPPAAADTGPAPTFQDAVRLGEAQLRARLIDPDSAHIEWPYNFISGSLKSMLSKRRAGFFTCGRVNAKNRMGGYTGQSWFLIIENSGVVTELDIGEGDGLDAATVSCNNFVKHGALPAAPTSATAPSEALQTLQGAVDASAAAVVAGGGLGVAFLTAPAGIVIMAVGKGTLAERSGLKAGQVVQSVNGIDLRGMPAPAVTAVIKALPKSSTLALAGGGAVIVSRP